MYKSNLIIFIVKRIQQFYRDFAFIRIFNKANRKLRRIAKIIFCVLLFVFNDEKIPAQCNNYLCNEGFDSVLITPPSTFTFATSAQLPCWQTTETSGTFEIWGNGFLGVPAYSGIQFIELNVHGPTTVFQDISIVPGTPLSIEFAHRGRSGIDSINLSVGPAGGPFTVIGEYGSGNSAWETYFVTTTPLVGWGSAISVRFNSIYTSGPTGGYGNLLDALSVCESSVLPIQLLSFFGKCENNIILLEWETESESQNDFFTIEKSWNGMNWLEIGTVAGSGSSSTQQHYSFTDTNLSENGEEKFYYRLKQTDYNGNQNLFNPIAVICGVSENWEFVLQNTPVTSELTGTLFLDEETDVDIEITDITGKLITKSKMHINEGNNFIRVDMQGKAAGVYVIHLYNAQKELIMKFQKI